MVVIRNPRGGIEFWQTVQLDANDANSPVNNSIVVVDSELTFEAIANASYVGYVMALYTSGTTADWKWAWSVPAGMIGRHGGSMHSNQFVNNTPAVQGNAGWSSVNRSVCIPFSFINAGVAGTVTFQYAQVIAEVVDTILLADSALMVRRVTRVV